MADAGHTDAEGLVDFVPGGGAGGLELFGNLLQALDLKADVVDAAVGLAVLRAGYLVVLEVEDRQVDVAVAEVVALGVGGVKFGDFAQAENFGVEPGGGVGVLGGNGDMLNLGHNAAPPAVGCFRIQDTTVGELRLVPRRDWRGQNDIMLMDIGRVRA